MPANLENSAVATGLEMVGFHSNPKERHYQKNDQTTAQLHSSHRLAKQCSKFSKPGFNKTWTHELPDVQAGFRKGRRTRDQIDNIHWIIKKERVPEKISTSALLTMSKPLTVWITINWKILKELGIPDHLTCLLRNLYAGQEAKDRTGHGTTDWFQLGEGWFQVH